MTASEQPQQGKDLVEMIMTARFKTARREGYDAHRVDDWLDALVAEVEAGNDILPHLNNVAFELIVRMGARYRTEEVDNFIDQLIFAAGGPPPPPPRPPAPEPPGFFGRLFGRR